MPRLLAYPVLWPYGTYTQLHPLHHAWNGVDLRDPERVQWTAAEYDQASAWQRWYVRHQWWVDIGLLGGIGLIAKTLWQGWHLGHTRPNVQRALWLDLVGIVAIQGGLAIATLHLHRFWDYLLFWFILERIIGLIQQTRDHLEHYGLWQPQATPMLTQLYASRNIQTPDWLNWLLGGLPHHAVHHAFPHLPFYALPEATQRLQPRLQQAQHPPLTFGSGYWREAQRLGTCFSLIAADPRLPTQS